MSDKGKSRLNLERILSIVAVIAAGIALYFSWEANRIAGEANEITLRQNTEQVVALASGYIWAIREQDTSDFVCVQQTRLSNLGGAGASIVKYEATVSFKDEKASVDGEQAYPLTSTKLGDIISGFRVEFVNRDTLESDSDPSLFPIQISPFSTVDIWTKASFSVNTNVINLSPSFGDYFYPPYDLYAVMEPGSKSGNLSPVEISFTFQTATGKAVSATPKALCIYLK